MQGPSKSVGNATAAANAPCTDSFLSRIQKVLKLAFANLTVLLPSAFQVLHPARKMKSLNILKKKKKERLVGTKIINSEREQSPFKCLSLICIPRGTFRAAPIEIGGN